MKAGVEVDPAMPGAAAILERLLDTRVESRWGCLSLTGARARRGRAQTLALAACGRPQLWWQNTPCNV
jgi:hypothetical protein